MLNTDFYHKRVVFLSNRLHVDPSVKESLGPPTSFSFLTQLSPRSGVHLKVIQKMILLLIQKETSILFLLEKYLSEKWMSSARFITQRIPSYTLVADTILYSIEFDEPSSKEEKEWYEFFDTRSLQQTGVQYIQENEKKTWLLHKCKTQLFGMRFLLLNHEFTVSDALKRLEWLWIENDQNEPQTFYLPENATLYHLIQIVAKYFSEEWDGIYYDYQEKNQVFPPLHILSESMNLVCEISHHKKLF